MVLDYLKESLFKQGTGGQDLWKRIKLSFKYDVESHVFTLCFTRLTPNWQSLANHAMLRKKKFLTGTVRLLICSEIWLHFNQWRTINFLSYDPECRKIHLKTEFSTTPNLDCNGNCDSTAF